MIGDAALADRLARTLLTPEAAAALDVHGRTDAAVLVAIFVRAGRLHAVLTRRRDDLRRHPGEISFPGGRRDSADPDLVATALREAHEEIGLEPSAARVLGALQPTPTIVTGYSIYPFVALIDDGTAWRLSAGEVAEVLEPALADLRAGYARRTLLRRGLPIRTDTYAAGEAIIWGATARILADLFERIDPLLGDE
ncbi:MAG: NUDIX hydrolase [Solirubrobacteraceae bacterium]